MASQWTSKSEILHDLSVAQGREVPVEILNPITCNEKPPALNYTEETEEEHFADYAGGGDLETGPDLKLIKQMLDMVRDVNIRDVDDTEVDNRGTSVEISKIDTHSSSLRNNYELQSKLLNSTIKINKPKKERNIAVASLIEIYGNNKYVNETSNETQTKLLKPDDFVYSVKNACKSNNDARISSILPTFKSPTSMFRKKSPTVKSFDNTTTVQSKDTTVNDETIAFNEPACFIPSSQASELYKTYLEKSKCLEQTKEDIWTRAERKMRELDTKRKNLNLNVNGSPLSSFEDIKSEELKGMDFVRLPQHRHLLTGDCAVCEVVCAHRQAVTKLTDQQDN